MNEGHPWLDQAPAYALDALDEDERVEFEKHLESCERCREAVEDYRHAAASMAGAAPSVEPPPGLREAVLARARTKEKAGEGPPATPPPGPERTGLVSAWGGWLAAAAALVVALGTTWAFLQERQSRQAAEAAYQETEEAYRTTLEQLARQDSLLDLVLGPDVQAVSLVATDQPSGQLFWNRERRTLVIAVHNLEPPPAGRIYQLWGIPPGRDPVSLGTFSTAADGEAVVTASLPEGLDMAVSAVTEEPAGGSPQPTTQPFLVAAWASSE